MQVQIRSTGRELRVDARFQGPDGMGNGGYVVGLLAERLGAPAEVTIRRPVPLDQALWLETAANELELRVGDGVLASAREAEALAVDVPAPVSLDHAADATTRFLGHQSHPFPRCFVCGPERGDDALRIFSGPVAPGRVVSPFRPGAGLADGDGHLLPRYVAAALDCPTGWALADAQEPEVMLLGRMTFALHAPVPAGEPLVVDAFALGSEGRKRYAASALRTADGSVLAIARATWIAIAQA